LIREIGLFLFQRARQWRPGHLVGFIFQSVNLNAVFQHVVFFFPKRASASVSWSDCFTTISASFEAATERW